MTTSENTALFQDAETLRVAIANMDVAKSDDIAGVCELLLRGIEAARLYLGLMETFGQIDQSAMIDAQHRRADAAQRQRLQDQVLGLLNRVKSHGPTNARPSSSQANGEKHEGPLVKTGDAASISGPYDSDWSISSDLINDMPEDFGASTRHIVSPSRSRPPIPELISRMGPAAGTYAGAASVSIGSFVEFLQASGVNDVELLRRFSAHSDHIAHFLTAPPTEATFDALRSEIEKLKETISALAAENAELTKKLKEEPSEFWAKFNEGFSTKLGEVTAETLGTVVKMGGLAAISGLAAAVGWTFIFAGPEQAPAVQSCFATYAQLALE